jgi:hypothetical protein
VPAGMEYCTKAECLQSYGIPFHIRLAATLKEGRICQQPWKRADEETAEAALVLIER